MNTIERRRAFKLEGYATLADAGFDGDYVTPYQIASNSSDGPCLIAYNWLDFPSALEHRTELLEKGYLPSMPFNKVLDLALERCGLTRSDIYMTQAFHLLPKLRSQNIGQADVYNSFDAITRHEIDGRRVITLGRSAANCCNKFGIQHAETIHPSSRGFSYHRRADIISAAILNAMHGAK